MDERYDPDDSTGAADGDRHDSGPASDPFPDEGPILQARTLGWKRVAGIAVLAGLGYLAAHSFGWIGGDRSGVPFQGTPLDSAGEAGPAVRGPGVDTPAAGPDSQGGTAAWDTSAAPQRAGGDARVVPGGVASGDVPPGGDVPGEAAPPAGSPERAAEPGQAPELPREDGPLPLSEFVLIRPGSFQMGYPDAAADQRPVHAVILSDAYYLQRSEVTQRQWRSVMGANPSHFSGCDDCPVEQVSWHDVQAFLKALNERYPGRNYRLPTEAEWEYAARADQRADYEDVGALDEAAWYDANSGARTRPVESKLANPLGLYDMHGNVAEWVSDWYRADYYGTGPAVDPPGPRDGAAKVVRGGSWGSPRRFVATLGRMDREPFTRDWSIGFRLARDP